MLFKVLPTLQNSSHACTPQDLLYQQTRGTLAQAKASLHASLQLVQAARLVAQREYTLRWHEAAYISVHTCVGMMHVAGIGTDRTE